MFGETLPDMSCMAFSLRYCVEKLIRDTLFGYEEANISNLIDNKLSQKWIDALKKANEKKQDLLDLYHFCNNNWAHYWDSDGFQSLIDQTKIYFGLSDYILNKNEFEQILNTEK